MNQQMIALMNHGICIYEDNGKIAVRKIPTSLDPRPEIPEQDQSGNTKSVIFFDTHNQALTYALMFIGEEKEITTIRCSVALGYRPNGGRLQIADLDFIEVRSAEEAEATAKEMAKCWFNNHPDIWDMVKTPDETSKNYEIRIRPIGR